jgi:hypothetical protein
MTQKITGYHLTIGGDHRAWFSTWNNAHKWLNEYRTEFPAVRHIGWEIREESIDPSDTKIFAPYDGMDPPMHFRRGDPEGTLIPPGCIMSAKTGELL